VPSGSIRVIKGPHICGDAIDIRVRKFQEEILSTIKLYVTLQIHLPIFRSPGNEHHYRLMGSAR